MTFKLLPKPVTGCIVMAVTVMLLVVPIQTSLMAQDTGAACLDGERQANSDISGGTWFAIGCLAGIIGYLIAQSESNPPATALLGKSPEYVAVYTDCYRKKSKQIKSKNALTGCLVGVGLNIALYAILIASAESSTVD